MSYQQTFQVTFNYLGNRGAVQQSYVKVNLSPMTAINAMTRVRNKDWAFAKFAPKFKTAVESAIARDFEETIVVNQVTKIQTLN